MSALRLLEGYDHAHCHPSYNEIKRYGGVPARGTRSTYIAREVVAGALAIELAEAVADVAAGLVCSTRTAGARGRWSRRSPCRRPTRRWRQQQGSVDSLVSCQFPRCPIPLSHTCYFRHTAHVPDPHPNPEAPHHKHRICPVADAAYNHALHCTQAPSSKDPPPASFRVAI